MANREVIASSKGLKPGDELTVRLNLFFHFLPPPTKQEKTRTVLLKNREKKINIQKLL